LVESALARPLNLAAYGDPDAAGPAAAYAYGLAKNHGFADGNKRTAWVAARLFLADNGYALQVNGAEAVQMVEALAEWFRARIR
jgi:death-on-curing protein